MADGISVGGSLTVDNSVVFVIGAIAVSALVGTWIVGRDNARKMLSYHAVSNSAQNVEQRILDRLAMNLPVLRERPNSVRAAIARYRNELSAAMLAYRKARLDFKERKITKAQLLQAAAALKAVIEHIMEQIKHEFQIPTQHSMYAMVTPLWSRRRRIEDAIRASR